MRVHIPLHLVEGRWFRQSAAGKRALATDARSGYRRRRVVEILLQLFTDTGPLRGIILCRLNNRGVVIEEHSERGADGRSLAKAVGNANSGRPVVVGVVVDLFARIYFDIRGQHSAGDARGLL